MVRVCACSSHVPAARMPNSVLNESALVGHTSMRPWKYHQGMLF